jgi:putative oxidoreductase
MKPLGFASEYVYSFSRAIVGFLFLAHGLQKLFGVLGAEQAVALFSQLGLAGLIELFAGTLIMLGLYTPVVAFLASGLMATAYFLAHLPRNFWPIMNGGELAVLYCFVFLYFSTRGSGPLSLDRILRGRS